MATERNFGRGDLMALAARRRRVSLSEGLAGPHENRHNLGAQMRELTDHKVNPANDVLTVAAMDEPGSGGAHHHYRVTSEHPSFHVPTDIVFQNGPINDAGVNGLTHEVLLAIVADRLRDFQKGPYASRYNALALTHIEDAQNWLNRRTLERMRRGVEGTHKA